MRLKDGRAFEFGAAGGCQGCASAFKRYRMSVQGRDVR